MHRLLLLALALCACNPSGPVGSRTPETLIDAQKAKWDQVAGRSYSITYVEWSIDGTATITCEANHGVVGSCGRVYRCCGEDPDSTTLEGYDTPGEILAKLKSDVTKLAYDSSSVEDTGFFAQRTWVDDGDTLSSALAASFDPEFGYPKQIWYLGAVLPSALSITRFIAR